MIYNTTNLFCIIGKPYSGKSTLMNELLKRENITNLGIKKLVYGTTREQRINEVNGESYNFVSLSEFENINEDDIIESRIYDDIITGNSYYYFTLKSDIKLGNNYLMECTIFQYEELKKWIMIRQLRSSTNRMNIYPIVINSSIFERLKRGFKNVHTEDDVYRYIDKILSERFEFTTAIKNNPELSDYHNPDTCIIENKDNAFVQITVAVNNIEKFIIEKLTK